MKILVIPDIHGRKFWRGWIDSYSKRVNKVVFLGDYLDPYPEEIQMAPETMECNSFEDSKNLLNMLNDIVSLKKNEPDKYVLLTGNHTNSYIWSKFHAASRTDYKNWEKYHKFFSENLNLFNLVYIQNNVIFSHAGISKEWAKEFATNLCLTIDLNKPVKFVARFLSTLSLENINDKIIKLLGYISFYRRGDFNYGSCEWADIREHIDFKNSTLENIISKGEENTYQIFGHTQLKQPLITDKLACLDCRTGFIIDTLTYNIETC